MAWPVSSHAPIIVTVDLAANDQAWLDGLRRRHFPPERNQLPAHLTMFHSLGAMLEPELKHRLAIFAAELPPPRAQLAGLMNLGSGVAFRIVSDDLDHIRAELADAFRGSLTQQDQHGWRPHVTIQNKVISSVAVATLTELERGFTPRPLGIAGLAYHHYEGGPWRLGKRYAFRG